MGDGKGEKIGLERKGRRQMKEVSEIGQREGGRQRKEWRQGDKEREKDRGGNQEYREGNRGRERVRGGLTSLHMTSIGQGSHAGLGGSLILSHLETDLSVSQLPLLVLVPFLPLFLRHLRSKAGPGVFRMFLGDAAEGVDAENHLRDVASLEQVSCLEDLLMGYTVFLNGVLEPLNILHELEGSARRLNLLDRVGLDLVNKIAESDAIFEYVLEVTWWQLLPHHRLHPLHHLLFQLLVSVRHGC